MSPPDPKLKFSGKLHFNGVEYDSPDSMPPDVRKLYEEASALLSMGDLASTTLKGEQAMQAEIARRLDERRSFVGRYVWIVLGLLAFFLVLLLFKSW